jgi:hypothetical protein
MTGDEMVQNLPVSDARIDAILVGGPADIPDQLRLCQVKASDDKVKLRHGRAHEHFERTADSDADRQIFRWTTRTFIAE